jgi:hypothetical protein
MTSTLPTNINIDKKRKCPECKKLFSDGAPVALTLTSEGNIRVTHAGCK